MITWMVVCIPSKYGKGHLKMPIVHIFQMVIQALIFSKVLIYSPYIILKFNQLLFKIINFSSFFCSDVFNLQVAQMEVRTTYNCILQNQK